MLSISAFPNVVAVSSFSVLNCAITDNAIGNIITVVAVFEIHIERKAVASIKPSITLDILVPMIEIIERAILL